MLCLASYTSPRPLLCAVRRGVPHPLAAGRLLAVGGVAFAGGDRRRSDRRGANLHAISCLRFLMRREREMR
eukprot:COSAG06_NODE_60914_length_269_cov_0.852941_1_plen_70_part_10